MGATSMMGARVQRLEDPRHLRGEANFVDDIKLPNIAQAAVLRSPYAHARIKSIDLSAALSMPGVIGAYTLADLWPGGAPSIPVLRPVPGIHDCPQYALAKDAVRYVGEGVVVVVADSRAQAEDAMDMIEVDYEPLAAVADYDSAMAEGAVALHDTVPGNVAARWTQGVGDLEKAFAEADRVISDTFSMQRYTGMPMETRGILATIDATTAELTIWPSGQWPHTQRLMTAMLLGIDEASIRVIQPDVGGGFGVKLDIYPEDLLIPLLARRLGRAVKWIEDRQEHLLSVIHSRQMQFRMDLALKNDGTILGLRAQVLCDNGGYMRTLGPVNLSLAICSLCGPYRVPSYEADALCVLTNKSPCSPYRGAGCPESAFARERLFDTASRELGMDPAEFRMKNLVPPDAMPYVTGMVSVEANVTYDSGDFPQALGEALGKFGYSEFRERQAKDREAGKLRGAGMCVYAQMAGVSGFESAEVSVDYGGKVTVVTGAAPNGQGHATALSQVVADVLEVPLERINVVFADSGRIPFGAGTFGSRTAVMAGNAAHEATIRVRDKAKLIAADMFEASVEDVEWREGGANIVGVPEKRVTLDVLAQAARPGGKRPQGMEPGLEGRFYFESGVSPFAYGAHIAEVEVDPETGNVKVERYVVVTDCGVIINPLLVEGQIVGGVAQGLGGALYEELAYDSEGQLLNANLLDYQLPTSLDLPTIEISHIMSPSPLNPLGVKGTAEGGAIAAHAVIANAVEDAIAHTGARVHETPLKPSTVWKLLNPS